MLALLCAGPANAVASPITWTFAGVTSGSLIPEIPIDTPIRLDWTFDSVQTNVCPPDATAGVYFGQHVTTTVGSYVFQADGFLISDSHYMEGCYGSFPDMELRLPTWTGPNFSNAYLAPVSPGYPTGLYWFERLNGAFPTAQPEAVRFEGPLFYTSGSVQPFLGFPADLTAVPLNNTAVPEPASLLLLASGVSALCARRSVRQRIRARIGRKPPR
jgi:hypothetical protein